MNEMFLFSQTLFRVNLSLLRFSLHVQTEKTIKGLEKW